MPQTRNPIYHFYNEVDRNDKGEVGIAGDRHFKCLHGNKRILTVTKKMKFCLNGESLTLQRAQC